MSDTPSDTPRAELSGEERALLSAARAAASTANGNASTNARTCRRCGYSLEGLPARANCPECGTVSLPLRDIRSLARHLLLIAWGVALVAITFIIARGGIQLPASDTGRIDAIQTPLQIALFPLMMAAVGLWGLWNHLGSQRWTVGRVLTIVLIAVWCLAAAREEEYKGLYQARLTLVRSWGYWIQAVFLLLPALVLVWSSTLRRALASASAAAGSPFAARVLRLGLWIAPAAILILLGVHQFSTEIEAWLSPPAAGPGIVASNTPSGAAILLSALHTLERTLTFALAASCVGGALAARQALLDSDPRA